MMEGLGKGGVISASPNPNDPSKKYFVDDEGFDFELPEDFDWEKYNPGDTPLFLDQLPAEGEEGDAFAAMQALAYEGTPEEVAENFKEHGNECFRDKDFDNALIYYTRALEQKSSDHKAVSVYYCNRAAVQLRKGNRGRAVMDCRSALIHNPENVKAHYRAAVACNQLNKWAMALKYVEDGLKTDPANAALLREQEAANKAIARRAAEAQAKAGRANRASKVAAKVAKALKKRGVQRGPALHNMEMYPDVRVYLDDDNLVHWPVLMLYGEHNQSDFLGDVCEDTPIHALLEHMFPAAGPPAPWDAAHRYKAGDLRVYVEVDDKMVVVDSQLMLGHVLQTDGYTVPHIPVFQVAVRGSEYEKEMVKED